MKLNDKTWLAIFCLICLVYVSLRLWNLTDSCLWFDEIFGIHAAEMDWTNLVWFVAQDLIHPPLFYALLKIWISVFGESLFWLRFFPVVFSALAVVPFILLCRRLKLSRPAIAVALTFFAANGSLIKYAQEIRMYSLLLFFGLVSCWLFARFLDSGKGYLLLIIANILLVYTHYFGWLIVASEVLAAVILARARLKQISLMLIAVALGFAPWLYAVWQAAKINANVGQNIGWMTKPGFSAILRFVFDLFQPIFYEQSNSNQNLVERVVAAAIALPILAAGFVAFGFYAADWKTRDATDKRRFALLSILTVAPVVLAFAASWILPYSIWGTRHLIFVFASFAVLSAIALSEIKFRQLRAVCLILIFALVAAAFLFQATRAEPKYIWCAWENLAEHLYDSTLHGEDAANVRVYTYEDLVAYHFWFALRDSDRGFQIFKVGGAAGMTEDKAYFLPRGFGGIQTIGEDEIKGERFFVAFRAKTWNEFAPPLQNLKAQGYKIGEPQIYEAQGVKAFLVEVKKGT